MNTIFLYHLIIIGKNRYLIASMSIIKFNSRKFTAQVMK